MKKQSQSKSYSRRFVTSPLGGPYPTYWKTQLIENVDLLIQSGSSPEEAYSRVAHDLQAQDFFLSGDDIQLLYHAFKQEQPDRRTGVNNKQTHSKVRLRDQKAILKAELRGLSLTPSEQDIQSVLDAIHALSLPEEEKRVLFQFFDPNEPRPERVVDYWKLEDRMSAICRNLHETPESKRFLELVCEMQSKALAAAVATESWIRSNELLRRLHEETGDSNALGAAVGAIKEVDGSWSYRRFRVDTRRVDSPRYKQVF